MELVFFWFLALLFRGENSGRIFDDVIFSTQRQLRANGIALSQDNSSQTFYSLFFRQQTKYSH